MLQLSSLYACSISSTFSNLNKLWHIHLGHPLDLLVNKFLGYTSVNGSKDICDKPCIICLRAKQTRDPFPLSRTNNCGIFYLIHINLWGPYKTVSTIGASYFLIILDDYFGVVCIHLISEKSEVTSFVKEYFAMVKTQFHNS